MATAPRFLVIDGYNREAREELKAGGASPAGDLYVGMLRKCLPGAACDVVHPADPGATLPKGAALQQYDGIAWTGCSLTIYDDDPRVGPQIELAKAAFAARVPSFGSCWAAQIAVAAAGGIVRANPRGREMGIARKIGLTPEGRGHPLYFGKSSVFDAFISHVDEITHLPPAAESFVTLLETLHQDPSRRDIAWLLGIDDDVMNEDIRLTEVRNWIDRLVIPSMATRH